MNITAVYSRTTTSTTTSYMCRFCGVSYDDVAEMHSCTICGQTVAGGWLVRQSHDQPEYDQPEHDQPAPGWHLIYRAA